MRVGQRVECNIAMLVQAIKKAKKKKLKEDKKVIQSCTRQVYVILSMAVCVCVYLVGGEGKESDES